MSYVSTTLGLQKSWYRGTDLQLLNGGLAANCSDELFEDYLKEARPVAEKIVDNIEQHQ